MNYKYTLLELEKNTPIFTETGIVVETTTDILYLNVEVAFGLLIWFWSLFFVGFTFFSLIIKFYKLGFGK